MRYARLSFLTRSLAFTLFVFATPASFALVEECQQIFASPVDLIPAKAAGNFRIMQYNVEMLVHAGPQVRVKPGQKRSMSLRDKPKAEIQEIVDITQAAKPDVAVWEEVQDKAIMQEVQDKFGMRDYTPYALPSNDHFGIGMWVHKDLKVNVQYVSHKDVMWNDPTQGGKSVPLFSRDVPALILTRPGEIKPFLIVLGIHAKSKRDRDGDPESNMLRRAQFEGEENIIKEYEAQYGADVSLVAVGDHNTDVRTSSEVEPIKPELIDGFDAAPDSLAVDDRGTQSFFPRDRNPVYSQLDAVMFNRSSNLKPVMARIVRYKDAKGKPKPLPSSFKERELQPSDHQAVIVDMKLAN